MPKRPHEMEFSAKTKALAAERAKGRCELCKGKFKRPEFDHRLPAALGGGPELTNCQVLCSACHKEKSADDVKGIRKADRQKRRHLGVKKVVRAPIPTRPKEPPKIDKISQIKSLGPPAMMRRFAG